jgi:hypothetical protein
MMQAELSCAPAGAGGAVAFLEHVAGGIRTNVETLETLAGLLLIGGLGTLGFQLQTILHLAPHC